MILFKGKLCHEKIMIYEQLFKDPIDTPKKGNFYFGNLAKITYINRKKSDN